MQIKKAPSLEAAFLVYPNPLGAGYFQGYRSIIPGSASRDSSKHSLGSPQNLEGNYGYPERTRGRFNLNEPSR